MKPCKEPNCAEWFGCKETHPEECDDTVCIYCGGYAQFYHNRMSFSCLDCDNHWYWDDKK